jgi:hypothetical protein
VLAPQLNTKNNIFGGILASVKPKGKLPSPSPKNRASIASTKRSPPQHHIIRFIEACSTARGGLPTEPLTEAYKVIFIAAIYYFTLFGILVCV